MLVVFLTDVGETGPQSLMFAVVRFEIYGYNESNNIEEKQINKLWYYLYWQKSS